MPATSKGRSRHGVSVSVGTRPFSIPPLVCRTKVRWMSVVFLQAVGFHSAVRIRALKALRGAAPALRAAAALTARSANRIPAFTDVPGAAPWCACCHTIADPKVMVCSRFLTHPPLLPVPGQHVRESSSRTAWVVTPRLTRDPIRGAMKGGVPFTVENGISNFGMMRCTCGGPARPSTTRHCSRVPETFRTHHQVSCRRSSSSSLERDVHEFCRRFAVLDSFSNHAQRQRLHVRNDLIVGLAVAHDA